MPFLSDKERRWMFANKPKLANKWVAESKNKGEPVTKQTKSPWTSMANKFKGEK